MDETEIGTREDARPTTDPDDDRFVGIRPEVQRILRATDERIGDQLTEEQERAARAMALLLDAAAVDRALDLAPGTVRSWMDCEAFVKRVVEQRRNVMLYRPADEDFGRLLNPKQRAAARLRGLDMMSQIEVARALEVTDRTIRNWERNAAFRLYQDQLEHEESRRRGERRNMEVDRLTEAREKALEVLVRAVEQEGDRKAALELLKLPK
ncbi:MAG: hypothetical protein H0W55_15045 [Actinobacteria bacterium]|nr:hypothetical protein [Actinomycetota bacterium]MDQ3533759.1 hypothetical protein [Actinomycetota bacterium]